MRDDRTSANVTWIEQKGRSDGIIRNLSAIVNDGELIVTRSGGMKKPPIGAAPTSQHDAEELPTPP